MIIANVASLKIVLFAPKSLVKHAIGKHQVTKSTDQRFEALKCENVAANMRTKQLVLAVASNGYATANIAPASDVGRGERFSAYVANPRRKCRCFVYQLR